MKSKNKLLQESTLKNIEINNRMKERDNLKSTLAFTKETCKPEIAHANNENNSCSNKIYIIKIINSLLVQKLI